MIPIHIAMKHAVFAPCGVAAVNLAVISAVTLMRIAVHFLVLLPVVTLDLSVKLAVFPSRGIIPVEFLMFPPIFSMQSTMLVANDGSIMVNVGRLPLLALICAGPLSNNAAEALSSLAHHGR